ncbi:MAG: universal stress protein [Halovenus sp.]
MGERVLVPLDGSPLSYRALRHALEKFPDAEVVVFHVSDVFEPWQGRDDESIHEPQIGSDEWYAMEQEVTDELFSEAEEIAAEHDREITTESEIGDPQRIIPEYAKEEEVDHVVLGVHGREEAERTLFGRVAETVVFRSPVPVTVIR